MAFIDAFRTLGFSPCHGPENEPGFEKVAIYADGNGIPTHMARQVDGGGWTSKLGSDVDIHHDVLDTLHGPAYGSSQVFLRRPKPCAQASSTPSLV